MRPRSQDILGRPEWAMQRALFKSMGYSDYDLERPLIGIANSWNRVVPGHYNLNLVSDYVKQGGRKKGTKGLSSNRAGLYFAAVRIFYDENGFPLKVKTPTKVVKKENFKIKIRPEQIRKLLGERIKKG